MNEKLSDLIATYGSHKWFDFIERCRPELLTDNVKLFLCSGELETKYGYLMDDFKRFLKLKIFL
jgi:hypothetical protein